MLIGYARISTDDETRHAGIVIYVGRKSDSMGLVMGGERSLDPARHADLGLWISPAYRGRCRPQVGGMRSRRLLGQRCRPDVGVPCPAARESNQVDASFVPLRETVPA